MEAAAGEECSIWVELYYDDYVQPPLQPHTFETGVLLNCNTFEVLDCSVAEMLGLDFTSGVIFSDTGSVVLQQCQR